MFPFLPLTAESVLMNHLCIFFLLKVKCNNTEQLPEYHCIPEFSVSVLELQQMMENTLTVRMVY